MVMAMVSALPAAAYMSAAALPAATGHMPAAALPSAAHVTAAMAHATATAAKMGAAAAAAAANVTAAAVAAAKARVLTYCLREAWGCRGKRHCKRDDGCRQYRFQAEHVRNSVS
jgi:hypothetical protein